MIRLYDKNEITFGHNETILTPIKCEVAEEENGQFELEYESMPNPMIVAGSIIEAPTPRGPQLFRVYKPTHTLRKTKAKARHITYDLMHNFLEDVRPTSTTGSGAIHAVLAGTLYPHPFKGSSTVATIASAYYIRKNPIQALIGSENCVVSRWGGFIQRDNFSIRHIPSGRDLGYEVRYGKNLNGIEMEIDDSRVVTKLMPTWVDKDNNTVKTLPERYIDSPLINAYPSPRVGEIRITVPENETNIEGYVRSEARKQFSEFDVDKLLINYKINFIALRDLPEYKDFVWVEEVDLYDTVEVTVEKLGIKIAASVIKYTYDAIKERFVKIEIGNFSNSLARNTAQTLKQIDTKIELKSEEILALQKEATAKILGTKGGNVVTLTTNDGKPYATLYMDTDDVATAKNVVIANNQGIGFSQNGVAGPYSVAITIDGHIVADFIDAGTLTAAIIKTGVLSDQSGKFQMNLKTGAMNLGNKIIYNPDTNQFTVDGNMLVNAINGTNLNISGKNISLNGSTSVDGTFKVSGNALFGTIDAQQIRIRNQDLSEFVRGMLPISTAQIGIGQEFKIKGSGANFGANSQYLVINDTGGRGQVLVQGTVAAHGSNYYVEMHSGGLILDRSQMTGVWSNGGYASFRNDRFKFGGKEVYVDGNNFLKVR